jgi:hypothetical protein
MAKKSEVIESVNLTITSPKRYEVTIKGVGGLLFNRKMGGGETEAEKKNQEKIDLAELERKIWPEKAYFDSDNQLFIPGENIHQCMKDGCAYWGQKIPGAGNKTYTDVVASSVIVENLILGESKDKLVPFGKWVNGNPSKGKKSGCKVYKIRPLLMPWGGTFVMHVFDARLSEHILKVVLSYAGMYRGLGDWRPTYGRFELVSIKEI